MISEVPCGSKDGPAGKAWYGVASRYYCYWLLFIVTGVMVLLVIGVMILLVIGVMVLLVVFTGVMVLLVIGVLMLLVIVSGAIGVVGYWCYGVIGCYCYWCYWQATPTPASLKTSPATLVLVLAPVLSITTPIGWSCWKL